jgi:hypothetical protein
MLTTIRSQVSKESMDGSISSRNRPIQALLKRTTFDSNNQIGFERNSKNKQNIPEIIG